VVFNAISGFVLTLPLAARGGGLGLSAGRFFRRRFGRICPQYYLALALWSAVALLTAPAGAPPLWRAFAEHALFVHTLDPARFYAIVPALWWMGLLAQFYLFYPLVLRLFSRLGPGRAMLAVTAGCFGVWGLLEFLAGRFPDGPFGLWAYMIYFNLPARLPEFAMGMYLAFWWVARHSAPVHVQAAAGPRGVSRFVALAGAAAVAVAVTAAGKGGLPLPAAHFLICGSCLLVVAALFSLPVTARLGETRLVVRLGALSYSFYLIHQPLVGYGADMLKGRMPPLAAFGVLAVAAGALALAGALAMDRVAGALWSRGSGNRPGSGPETKKAAEPGSTA
ncbi:MAG: acyltransferase family protein, partial [Thermodesulfobacteriota bacterium]